MLRKMITAYYWKNIPYKRENRSGIYYADMWMLYNSDHTPVYGDELTQRFNTIYDPEEYTVFNGKVESVKKAVYLRDDSLFDATIVLVECSSAKLYNDENLFDDDMTGLFYMMAGKMSDTFNFWMGNYEIKDEIGYPIFGLFEDDTPDNETSTQTGITTLYIDTMENKKSGITMDSILNTDFFELRT